jgi:transposase-like protein
LIACVDGLKGFPDAIEAVFPQTWVQTCIVHPHPHVAALRQLSRQADRRQGHAPDLHRRYCNADDAVAELDAFEAEWGERYPPAVVAWRNSWVHVTPFLALPGELRRRSTRPNTIEAMHRQVRKATKTRGHFPDEHAATKFTYLPIHRAEARWTKNRAWTSARGPQDPLPRPIPRLTINQVASATHRSSDSLPVSTLVAAKQHDRATLRIEREQRSQMPEKRAQLLHTPLRRR